MDLPFREDQQKISYRKKKLQNVVYGMKTFEWSSILQKILQKVFFRKHKAEDLGKVIFY